MPRGHVVIKRAAVVERSSAGRKLVFIGDRSAGGTYVLRIRVHKLQHVAFGRFKNGRLIILPPGDYAYVGSAMGNSGQAVCLAKRLVRHATRLGTHKPHQIRKFMLQGFPKLLRADRDKLVAAHPKKQKWHVDYALDRHDVELVGAFVISSRLRIEARLAKHLECEPGTVVFEKGAGATDVNGNTHFLRIEGGDRWWNGLPEQIQRVLLFEQLVQSYPEHAGWLGAGAAALSLRQTITVLNMRRERTTDILTRMKIGLSFGKAEEESSGTYDTHDWKEVLSRLQRGSGSLRKVVEYMETLDHGLSSAQRGTLSTGAEKLKAVARSLMDVFKNGTPRGNTVSVRIEQPQTSIMTWDDRRFNNLNGKIKQCLSFVMKNLRDVPLVAYKTGLTPTLKEDKEILRQIGVILSGAERLSQLLSPGG
jgi:Uri superfamily endonuclease